MAGGIDKDVLNSSEFFGVFTDVWQSGPHMRTARMNAPVLQTSAGLWVIGGRNSENEVLTSVELLPKLPNSQRKRKTSVAKTFREATPLPLAVEGLAATVVNDIIYVSGTTVKTQESTILKFDGKNWTPAGKLNHPRYSSKGNIMGTDLNRILGSIKTLSSLATLINFRLTI